MDFPSPLRGKCVPESEEGEGSLQGISCRDWKWLHGVGGGGAGAHSSPGRGGVPWCGWTALTPFPTLQGSDSQSTLNSRKKVLGGV